MPSLTRQSRDCRNAVPLLFFVSLALQTQSVQGDPPIDFNQDVRPILSENCFACHGPDAQRRAADLRLDTAEGAIGIAILPGDPAGSSLIQRIESTSEEERMPPPDSHKSLTDEQKDILRNWVSQGAPYQKHWSFEPLVQPTLPAGVHPVDYLLQERLKTIGLPPAERADHRTLARRVYFDLIGLPPTHKEITDFEQSDAHDAYEHLVKELMGRPQYGERMAMGWLDVVRFADTIGYHSDTPRNIWPYRDYVIRSFQENKPFDQFTIEQLAGDLLENPTQETRVASAFNRLLLTTEEGGAQAKDYEQRMLTDRVRAVGAVWLGLTTGCAQCHDHKFDPFTAQDFYSLGAFFADIEEGIIAAREPGMTVLSHDAQAAIDTLKEQEEKVQSSFQAQVLSSSEAQQRWVSRIRKLLRDHGTSALGAITPTELTSEKGTVRFHVEANGTIVAQPAPSAGGDGKDVYVIKLPQPKAGVEGFALKAIAKDGEKLGLASNGNFVLSEVQIQSDVGPFKIETAVASFEQPQFAASQTIDGIADQQWNGWAVLGGEGKDQTIRWKLAEPIPPQDEQGLDEQRVAELEIRLSFAFGGQHQMACFQIHPIKDWKEHEQILEIMKAQDFVTAVDVAEDKQTETDRQILQQNFARYAPELEKSRTELATIQSKIKALQDSAPKCLVSVATPNKRVVRILPRGNWMDESGEIVQAAVPKFIEGDIPQDRQLNRLDLARWLVSPQNPLTARTVMNRMWKHFFGTGLSRVLDDLGAQGETPANQALLDWLAAEFIASGWDYKHMVHQIVTSEAYQQSSNPTAEQKSLDPTNREWARQATFRLDAELIRDMALSVSGALEKHVGGPSVYPYQPEGYWDNLNFPVRSYPTTLSSGQYRRGLYTWWQRSFVHPSLLAFDAPTREECAAERTRSNIPQQALVLLNDPTYVETAKLLAIRVHRECDGDTNEILHYLWHVALQREPSEQELEILSDVLHERRNAYGERIEDANRLLSVGLTQNKGDLDSAKLPPTELAAWTHVCRIVLNLHESITRP